MDKPIYEHLRQEIGKISVINTEQANLNLIQKVLGLLVDHIFTEHIDISNHNQDGSVKMPDESED